MAVAMRYPVSVLTALAVAALAVACGATHSPTSSVGAVPAAATVSCVGYFAAHVRNGPDARSGFHGDISMTIVPGTAAPRVMLALYAKGARPGAHGYQGAPLAHVPTSVRISGRVWTMVFQLPGGLVMSGTGTIRHAVRACGDAPMSGTLSGPRPADRGDWDCIHGTRWPILQDTQTQLFEIIQQQ